MELHEPQLQGSQVRFGWEVTPATELYTRTEFRLSFPAGLDLTLVPRALWWRIQMLSLHTHWALLRPCQVELPVSLGDAEREFWLRLIDNVTVQLEAYGSRPRVGRAVQIADRGPPLEPSRVRADPGRVAVAFSGGKDSLVLAGLVSELIGPPLLVTVTSPVSWARDHLPGARDHTRAEVARRLGTESIEVTSDFRTAWEMPFSALDGCRLGVHELSDLPLYQATVAAVSAATGRGRMLMASEADLQYNAELDGRVVLHPEFLSCAVTQDALDALLGRFGLSQGSLCFPLHMPQVQELLLRRYGHLADLQYSCWKAPAGHQACSHCEKCFQIALVSLATGVSPGTVGIDAVEVLCAFADWPLEAERAHRGPDLHESRSARHHVVRCLQAQSTETVEAILATDSRACADPRRGEALAVYARLRADSLWQVPPRAPGYIAGFLERVPADLRTDLRSILDQHFRPAPEPEFAAILKRSLELTDWITAPLTAPGG